MNLAMQLSEMRECGLYALPDGSQVVARRGGRHGLFKLYDAVAWTLQCPAMYETDAQGKITSLGIPTPWLVEDLREVGEAA